VNAEIVEAAVRPMRPRIVPHGQQEAQQDVEGQETAGDEAHVTGEIDSAHTRRVTGGGEPDVPTQERYAPQRNCVGKASSRRGRGRAAWQRSPARGLAVGEAERIVVREQTPGEGRERAIVPRPPAAIDRSVRHARAIATW